MWGLGTCGSLRVQALLMAGWVAIGWNSVKPWGGRFGRLTLPMRPSLDFLSWCKIGWEKHGKGMQTRVFASIMFYPVSQQFESVWFCVHPGATVRRCPSWTFFKHHHYGYLWLTKRSSVWGATLELPRWLAAMFHFAVFALGLRKLLPQVTTGDHGGTVSGARCQLWIRFPNVSTYL